MQNKDIVELFVRQLGLLFSRIEVEEQVHKSEERYRLMAENSSDVIWVLNLNTMQFMYNSPSVYELRGFTSEEANAQKIEETLTPESLAVVQKMLAEEVPLFLKNPDCGRVWLVELEQIHKDGHALWTELAIKPRFTAKGELEVVGVTRSIEQRKKLELQLQKQAEDQQILLDNIPTQIWYLTDPETCGAVNKAYADFNGFTKAEMEHRKLHEVYPKDDADRYVQSNIEVFEHGAVQKIEQWVTNHKGDIRLLILNYTPRYGEDGQIEYVVCSAEDITDFRKTQQELIIAKEKAEESDKLKTAFLASMNHELRTPLNHIMGFSQLITTAEDRDEILDCANHIYRSGEALLKMIQDIFDLALAEQSIMQPSPQLIKCFDHFFENKANLEDIFESSGKQADVTLVFSPDLNALRKSVYIDVGKVNQVLNNLFRNAVKFTHKGTIEFGFELLSKDRIRYYVKDTGIGIPPDKQEIIFDFFRQADDSNTRVYGGVGIGLAISKKVTEVMKGHLHLKSELGVGSRFCLEIPCANPETEQSETFSYPDYSGKTVLLVDDDKTSMAVSRTLLEKTGAIILEAHDGKEAFGLVDDHPEIDVVLMDLMMPGLDGYQASQMVKKIRPTLPIFAVSAHIKANPEEQQLYNKFDCLISKPVSKEILYLELSKFLKK
jgi:PAS domain S-box-containing protein